jgi:hypothetical protein
MARVHDTGIGRFDVFTVPLFKLPEEKPNRLVEIAVFSMRHTLHGPDFMAPGTPV